MLELMRTRWIFVFFVVVLFSVSSAEAQLIRVRAYDESHRIVPPSTKTFIVLTAGGGGCTPNLPTERIGNQIDLLFTYGTCGTPLPGAFTNEYAAFLPAGTYTVRYVYDPRDIPGPREVRATLQFEVVEAGPPLYVPTMSRISLFAMAAAFVLIAIRLLR